MSKNIISNIEKSIHAKLKMKAKDKKIDVNILMIRYALERFLFRLSLSDYKEKFILKGAMLFLMWSDESFRTTKDSDFLMLERVEKESIKEIIKEICSIVPEENDGMSYNEDSIIFQDIKKEQNYKGLRVTLKSFLGKIPIPIQLDLGTGDIITPKNIISKFPTILESSSSPIIMTYTPETVIAEKLDAMVQLDLANSRMKDFYDIWVILNQLEYDKDILTQAIIATFKRRGTKFPKDKINALTPYFYDDKNKNIQWKAFMRKGAVIYNELTLSDVCENIKEQLKDIFVKIRKKI